MTAGHWQRQRDKGMGPRGGGGGHAKGPLRKIVRHRKVYTVSALPSSKRRHEGEAVPPYPEWRDWQTLLETESATEAMDRQRLERDKPEWAEVRLTESGWQEVLECGHSQPPVTDLIGETNAARRRCSKCKRGAPPDVAP